MQLSKLWLNFWRGKANSPSLNFLSKIIFKKLAYCVEIWLLLSYNKNMKKKIVANPFWVLGILSLLAVLLSSLFGGLALSISKAEGDGIKIRAYGDSISAGATLEGYDSYMLEDGAEGKTPICINSYPEVFSRKYISGYGGQVLGKGVSGDTSSDLVNILLPYINGTAKDLSDFNDTDIFTLCIGANNVLGNAISSLQNFLMGTMTEEEYQALLDDGVAQFTQDYPTILSAFEGKRTVVMTVYNPYKYLSLQDVQIHSDLARYETMIRNILNGYQPKLERMLELSMTALQQINDIIRQSAGREVYVADVWQLFETFDKTQYLEYINSDISQITLNTMDVTSLFSQVATACDPHPTAEGHAVIAQKHHDAFKYFTINFGGELKEEYESEEPIYFNIQTIEEGNFAFELYCQKGIVHTMIGSSATPTIIVKASLLEGENKLYVKVYDDDKVVYTTTSISCNVPVKVPPVINTTGNLILYISLGLVGACALIAFVFYIVRMSKRLRLY